MRRKRVFQVLILAFGCYLGTATVVHSKDTIKPLPRQYLKNINPEVQLQENGWVKIVNSFVYELTPEEAFHAASDAPMVIEEKKIAKMEGRPENIRKLGVDIQFLKLCNATTENPLAKEWNDSLKSGKPLSIKAQAEIMIFAYAFAQKNNEPKEKVQKLVTEFDQFCSEHGIDSTELIEEVSLPQFRCNYRTKVFVSFYDRNEQELETDGEIPFAMLIRSGSNERKTEMLPGEKTYVSFSIPDKAAYWYVWVPK